MRSLELHYCLELHSSLIGALLVSLRFFFSPRAQVPASTCQCHTQGALWPCDSEAARKNQNLLLTHLCFFRWNVRRERIGLGLT